MAKPVVSNAQIITNLTTSWNGGAGVTHTWLTNNIQFSLPTAAPNGANDEENGFQQLTANQASLARQAFQLWDDLIAVNITETTGRNAPIIFAYSSTTRDDGTYAHHELEDNTATDREIVGEDIWISSNWSSNQDANISVGTFGFGTYLHEIGHALGLSHPGVYNASDDEDPTYDDDATYSRDTSQYTIMSYFGAGADGSGADWNGADASTPMIDDIMAIQDKYGADMTTRTGNTTYGFNSNAGRVSYDFTQNGTPVFSIWDAGGNDTIDASLFNEDQTIDLRAGHYSSIGGLQLNIGIAYNVIIENATGGLQRDTMLGNDVANKLSGRLDDDELYGFGGSDTLEGGSGFDVLDGGSGVDVMTGGFGNDTYYVDNSGELALSGKAASRFGGGAFDQVWLGDKVIEQANQGFDTVKSWISYSLVANVENLELLGVKAINGGGNGLDNNLLGNSGANILTGGGGHDNLNGAGGVDTMKGGAGNDVYYVDNSGLLVVANARIGDIVVHDLWLGDRVVETAGNGFDTVYSSVSYTLAANVEKLMLTGDSALNGSGNGLDNEIFGNDNANFLGGNAGNDSIFGLGGNDTLNGGTGNDYLDGGEGADKMAGGTGDDTYVVDRVGRWHHNFGDVVDVTDLEVAMRGDARSAGIVGVGGFADTNTINFGGTYIPGDEITENADEGIDIVYTSLSYALGANLENLELIGSANVSAYGNTLDNRLTGNDSANLLDGRGGNDTLEGRGGADIFMFSTALGDGSVVTIADFTGAVDSIRLAASVFTSLTAGALGTGEFVTGKRAADADDHIIYNADTGALIYDENGSAHGGETQFATLDKNLDLASTDFVVV
jgi:Ca2+-binding RTX toxin-like protein